MCVKVKVGLGDTRARNVFTFVFCSFFGGKCRRRTRGRRRSFSKSAKELLIKLIVMVRCGVVVNSFVVIECEIVFSVIKEQLNGNQ